MSFPAFIDLELNNYITQQLPPGVYGHAMPLEVSDEFRDKLRGELLKQGITLKVADGAVLKRQCEYLAGRYCASESLTKMEQQLSTPITDKQVGTGNNREPLWPQGILGAITHSNRYAMALVGQQGTYQGIGVDIEDIMSAELAHSLCEQIMSAQEALLHQTLNDFDYKTFVTLIFSAKESIFKALFPSIGEYFGFEACELCTVDVAKKTLNFRLTGDLSDAWKKDTQLEVSYLPLPNHSHLQRSLLNPSLLTHQPSSWLTFTFLL